MCTIEDTFSLRFFEVDYEIIFDQQITRKTLNLYRKFKFTGNFKVTQYFVTIIGLHF